MKRFDRFILLFLAILLGLILILALQGDQVGVQVSAVIPAEGDQVGVYGPVGIEFAQPMDPTSAESHFSLTPAVSGRFEWEANTLWFFPDTLLDPEQTYQLTLTAGAQSANERELLETLAWTVTIRPPDILYLVLSQNGGDLWRWDMTAQISHALTETNGAVIDFDPDRTGEKIVYAVVNADGGSDLWRVDRDGMDNTLLLSCGLDYCSQPVWSPDGIWIAYARQMYNSDTGALQASQIWTVNTESKDTTALYQSEDAYGHTPSFSPDGQRLASYDTTHGGIRILNLETSQEAVIPTSLQEIGDWSSDGQSLLFVDLLPSALEPETVIYIANLENVIIQQTLGGDVAGTSFSQPRWSPDGDWIAVSLRPTNTSVNKALWILKTDGSEALSVADTPSANFAAYRWDPWGEQLVYQQLRTGASSLMTSIWLWDWETGESHLLVEGAARPQWLP